MNKERCSICKREKKDYIKVREKIICVKCTEFMNKVNEEMLQEVRKYFEEADIECAKTMEKILNGTDI